MTTELQQRKSALRAAALAQRNSLAPDAVSARSAVIARAVLALPFFTDAALIAGYMAIGCEVSIAEVLRAALACGKRVALPRTIPREHRLVLHAVEQFADLLPGPYGILEPPPGAPEVDPDAVELLLVPGLAFDAAGNRLGYGAGYYDRLLGESRGWRVAPAYTEQLVPEIPHDARDLPMHLIVTDAGMIDCAQGRAATDRLRLRNMTFYGHHGAFPQEREAGLRLAVDVDLRLDLQVPGLTDDLTTTVNYPQVYRLIERIQSAREFSLFEALVAHIADAILGEFPLVGEVTVTARKFHPPVGGLLDAFEVQMTRVRRGWQRQVSRF